MGLDWGSPGLPFGYAPVCRQSYLNTFTCTVRLLPPVFNLAQLLGRIAYSLYQGHTGIRRAVEILNLLR